MHNSTLLVMAATAGVLLLAAVVVLLYQRKIYINAATGQPTEIEMPLLGRVKTQNSVVAMVLIGTGLLIYPCAVSGPNMRVLEYRVENPDHRPYRVFVVAEPHYDIAERRTDEDLSRKIPILPDANYTLWFLVDGELIDQPVEFKEGKLVAPEVDLQISHKASDSGIQPLEEVSDEEIHKFLN